MNISDIAVKVRIHISCWGAEKTDRVVTEEVLSSKSAPPDGGKFIKSLLGGKCKELNDIQKFAMSCRGQLSTQTMPMGASTYYFPISVIHEILNMLKANALKFEELVSIFLDEYPNIIQRARESTSELLTDQQFMSLEEVRGKFNYEYVVEPISTNNGFDNKFDFGDLEQELKDSYDKKMAEVFSQGESLIINRLAARIYKVKTSMENFTGKGGIRQDMMNKSVDIVSTVEKLNIKNSADLIHWCRLAKEVFERPSISYREDVGLRSSAIEVLGGILREIGDRDDEGDEVDELNEVVGVVGVVESPELPELPDPQPNPFSTEQLDDAFSKF